jgi:glycosyltransferase involved in cell wall biosynthesis
MISVVVPFHNEARYVARCVESLLQQSYPPDRYEIIMVDNNSTDNSAEQVAAHARVKLLAESRPGSYAARNRGVAHSTGDVIAFTDGDCVASPDWLFTIALAMQHTDAKMLLGGVGFAHDSFGMRAISAYEMDKAAYVFSSDTPEIYFGYTNNMAMRRDVFDQAGPFVEMARGGDVLLVQKVIRKYACEFVRYIPEMRVQHLEIATVGSWYRKLVLYGKSYETYRQLASVRHLGMRERVRIFRTSAHEARLGPLRAAAAAGYLSLGAACFGIGRCLAIARGGRVNRGIAS